MKLKRTMMLSMVLVGLARVAQATLQLVPDDKPASVFSGEPRSIRVTFSNSSDQDFNSEIRVRIFQTSAATAAPVSEAAWKTLRVLPQQAVLESARLDFPSVKAETKFLVQWLENSNRFIGTTEVWVYPTNLLTELKPLLHNQTLGVFDPNNTLEPLLRQNGVEFVDLGESALEDFHGRLAILGPFHSTSQLPEDVVKRSKALMTNGTSVLWLQPPDGFREKLQPSYFSVILGTNAIVVAQSTLVENLRDLPPSQVRLLELCRQALQSVPPTLIDLENQP